MITHVVIRMDLFPLKPATCRLAMTILYNAAELLADSIKSEKVDYTPVLLGTFLTPRPQVEYKHQFLVSGAQILPQW